MTVCPGLLKPGDREVGQVCRGTVDGVVALVGWPRVRQPASEVVRPVAEQEVGDPGRLGPREPGRDKRVRQRQLLVDIQRPARVEDRHHPVAPGPQVADQLQVFTVRALELRVLEGLGLADIAQHLGVGVLTDHDQRDRVGTRPVDVRDHTVVAEQLPCSGQDRGRARKVLL